jgi:hypothetical protein
MQHRLPGIVHRIDGQAEAEQEIESGACLNIFYTSNRICELSLG